MNNSDSSPGFWHQVPLYVACYVLWVAFSALGILTMFSLRDNLLSLLPIVGPWIMGGLDKFGILLLGLVWLAYVIFLEHYLRQGIELKRFWQRVVLIAVIQAGVLAISYGLQLLPAWL